MRFRFSQRLRWWFAATLAVLAAATFVPSLGLNGLVAAPVATSAPTPAPNPAPNPTSPAPSTPTPTVPLPKDVAELRAVEAKVERVVAKTLSAVVGVRVGEMQGSGVLVSRDGLVLTAAHVVGKSGQAVQLQFADGKTVPGISLGMNWEADAAMVRITEPGDRPFVEMGRSGAIVPGSWCVGLGHPLGRQEGRPAAARVGRVLAMQDTTLRSDCMIVAGDSGGPLFDLEGRVIGIHSRITANAVGMNFHVPIDVFHQAWDRLLKGETVQWSVPGRESAEMRSAFQAAAAQAYPCVVRVRCDDADAALGTVVGPDGWILTKAGQLRGRIVCRDRNDKDWPARIVGVHEPTDLAMLKIEATGLASVAWSEPKDVPVGRWVVTVGPEPVPTAFGVVSVPPRRIPPAGGVLGLMLAEAETPAKAVAVLPDSPAQKVGMQPGDVVVRVQDAAVASRSELIAAVRRHRAGKSIQVVVQRGTQSLTFQVETVRAETLAARRHELQNTAGPGVNERHDDFPKVLQHDSFVRPTDCGGPLTDLAGRVVGINIARAGRTETYAVPTDVALSLMYELMSGRLAPPKTAPTATSGETPATGPTNADPAGPKKVANRRLRPDV